MKHNYCNCGGNDCGSGRIIHKVSEELFKKNEQYHLVRNTFVGLGLNRRQTARKVENIFCWQCRNTLREADGSLFVLPEFDLALPKDESCRWFERFLEADKTNIDLPKRYYNSARYKNRYILTLCILDIAAKIIDPEPFRKIGQIC